MTHQLEVGSNPDYPLPSAQAGAGNARLGYCHVAFGGYHHMQGVKCIVVL